MHTLSDVTTGVKARAAAVLAATNTLKEGVF
jgi:hypothetical protein